MRCYHRTFNSSEVAYGNSRGHKWHHPTQAGLQRERHAGEDEVMGALNYLKTHCDITKNAQESLASLAKVMMGSNEFGYLE